MNRTLLSVLAAAVLAGGLAAAPLRAGEPPIQTNPQGVALNGYDPVAYFTANRPIEGKAEHSTQWNNVEWHFASAENKEKFEKEPTKYAPQYGGHCAYGLAQGHLVPADPLAWKLVGGKLYLNFSKDVQATWIKDITGNIAKADKAWAAERKKS